MQNILNIRKFRIFLILGNSEYSPRRHLCSQLWIREWRSEIPQGVISVPTTGTENGDSQRRHLRSHLWNGEWRMENGDSQRRHPRSHLWNGERRMEIPNFKGVICNGDDCLGNVRFPFSAPVWGTEMTAWGMSVLRSPFQCVERRWFPGDVILSLCPGIIL